MVRKLLLILYALCSAAIAAAQWTFPPLGARNTALGGASAALCNMEAAADNMVAMAYGNRVGAGLSIRQNYMLNTMCYKSCFVAAPLTRMGAATIHYTHFGTSAYNEQQASLGYAMLIGDRQQGHGVALGLRFDYLYSGTSDAHYLPQQAITFAAGMQLRPTDEWCLGVQVFNPAVVHIQGTGAEQSTMANSHIDYSRLLFRLGASYRMTSTLMGTIELEKDLLHRPLLRAGMEYGWRQMLFVRTGMSTRPGCFSFGLGYAHRNYHIDMAAQMHPVLGLTPQLSLSYLF